jgi:hypothetical protein
MATIVEEARVVSMNVLCACLFDVMPMCRLYSCVPKEARNHLEN